MKSEPDVFSIDDLERIGREHWDGVRNYQARNHMQRMRTGDLVLFYHSSAKPPGVAGVARVCREAYPDHGQFDPRSKYHDPKATPEKPRWFMVDVEFVRKLKRLVTLDELKQDPALSGMLVVRRGMRLSVQPVEPQHFERVLHAGGISASLRTLHATGSAR
jgi:predicted RNA-binding protein with PUA-like domain